MGPCVTICVFSVVLRVASFSEPLPQHTQKYLPFQAQSLRPRSKRRPRRGSCLQRREEGSSESAAALPSGAGGSVLHSPLVCRLRWHHIPGSHQGDESCTVEKCSHSHTLCTSSFTCCPSGPGVIRFLPHLRPGQRHVWRGPAGPSCSAVPLPSGPALHRLGDVVT